MSSPNPHVDFVLPGWTTTPSARRACLLSLASAYSRLWNPRNLEYPRYEPWALILQSLVADLPPLAVAPQSYLWYYRPPEPGDYHIEPPQDDDSWLEDSSSTTDSTNSIHVGSRRSEYQLVDFAITRKVSRGRVPPAYTTDSQLKFRLSPRVDYIGIPVLCELKRGGPRISNLCANLVHAHKQLSIASEQLIRQAYHLFEMYPHQEEVVLVAVAGLWWSCRVLPRKESKIATASEVVEAEVGEASIRPDALEAAETQDGMVDRVVEFDFQARDEEDLSGGSGLSSIYRGLENVTFQDQICDGYSLHLLMTQTDITLKTSDWSLPLLFGTPPIKPSAVSNS